MRGRYASAHPIVGLVERAVERKRAGTCRGRQRQQQNDNDSTAHESSPWREDGTILNPVADTILTEGKKTQFPNLPVPKVSRGCQGRIRTLPNSN